MRQKRKKNNKGKIILLLIILAGLAFAVYVLFNDFPGGLANRVLPKGAENDEGMGNHPDQEPSKIDGSLSESDISSLWYFNSSNSERYLAMETRMPEIDMEDIVWMVEANLDKQPYSGIDIASAPESLTTLVNKYFSLPDGFSAPELVEIDNTMLRKDAAEAMVEMIKDAAKEGHRLWVQSGYRSYAVQDSLYQQYSQSDGIEGADTYSARPGHSEHQTGLAADLNTITDAFGELPEGRWVAENSLKYGYIMRYTKENTDITLYKPEPWHFRYIGKEAAALYKTKGILSYEEFWIKYVKNIPPQGGIPDMTDDGAEEENTYEMPEDAVG
jgi:D-alanyl-D-alanine carboxypeptidase